MKRILYLALFTMALCSCKNKEGKIEDSKDPSEQRYECGLFTLDYPNGYYIEEDNTPSSNFHVLSIGKDSLNKENTVIMWESPGSFPSNERDFVTIFASNEIDDYKKSNTFYDIMELDSTFTIDGYPTYSIVSIFEEGEDTIIQSRTGLIIPNKLDMMIVQKVNTKKSEDEVEAISGIIESIKIKK